MSKKDRHRYARIWIRSGDRCQLKRGRNVDTKGGRYESERGVCVWEKGSGLTENDREIEGWGS